MAKRHRSHVDDLASAFGRLEELVLANSDADEFEEILKLLIARFFDQHTGRPGQLGRAGHGQAARQVIEGLLRGACRKWPGVLTTGSDLALSDETLTACLDIVAGPLFEGSHLEALDGLFEGLVARQAKGAKGQYFTPRHVAELAVRMLHLQEGEWVLDPACGSAGFLWHAARQTSVNVLGADIDGRALRIAQILLMLGGATGARLRQLNSLVPPNGQGAQPTLDGWFEELGLRGADVIVTNPPFAGDVCQQNILRAYEWGANRARVERDVLFLERCVRLLRPGGRMAIVLPHNKLGGEAFAGLRRWLLERVQVLAVVGLHRHTFLPHTHQKAGLLVAQRRRPGEASREDEPIFFALSEKAGKSTQGRPIRRAGAALDAPAWESLEHDFDEIVDAWAQFHDPRRWEAVG